jgi:hypothetical protein
VKDEDQLPGSVEPGPAPLQPSAVPLHWPQIYYSLTLVFALVDWTMGANIRAVGLDHAPVMRAGYYGACLLCAVGIHYRPRWGTPIALVESSLNVGILIISVFLAYYGMVDTIEGPGSFTNPIDGRFMLNFLIAGGAGTAAFYQSLHALGLDRAM